MAWKSQVGAAADRGQEAVDFGSVPSASPRAELMIKRGYLHSPDRLHPDPRHICGINTILPTRRKLSPSAHAELQPDSFRLFSSPPDPTPSAVLLPASEKPMRHIVLPGAEESFYIPRKSLPPLSNPTVVPAPVPIGAEALDEETMRWLAAYPQDASLMPLINRLRDGEDDSEFVLSDVGLLYLRPSADETALLVPPRGRIREELLEDAHLGETPSAEQHRGEATHCGPSRMFESLSETFWWQGMKSDVEKYVRHCGVCSGEKAKAARG